MLRAAQLLPAWLRRGSRSNARSRPHHRRARVGFTAPTANSIDATSDRDFILEYLHALTFVGLHLSRFAEEITLFATAEFGFVALPEAFSTGSSAMPQKKNPDLTELIRAKVGRIHGAAQAVTLQLKGLPLAYNKDMQETQEPAFAVDFVPQMLALVARFTAALQFNRERMNEAAQSGYLNAMAAATYLVHKGVPFRTAHEKIGNAVRFAYARKALNSATSRSTSCASSAPSSMRTSTPPSRSTPRSTATTSPAEPRASASKQGPRRRSRPHRRARSVNAEAVHAGA